MQVIGFAGFSGAGKTTLVEQLVAGLRQRGQRVSVIKHAHHHFDIDREGKDSWRHRQAGAYEVLVASDRRLALMRELEADEHLDVHAQIALLDARVDWVLVEGFKHSDLPKVEVWRAAEALDREGRTRELLFPADARVWAVATDDAARLPQRPAVPVLDLNQPAAVLDWLLAQGPRLHYTPLK